MQFEIQDASNMEEFLIISKSLLCKWSLASSSQSLSCWTILKQIERVPQSNTVTTSHKPQQILLHWTKSKLKMRTISAPSSSKKSRAPDRVSKQLCNAQVQCNVCSNYIYSDHNQCNCTPILNLINLKAWNPANQQWQKHCKSNKLQWMKSKLKMWTISAPSSSKKSWAPDRVSKTTLQCTSPMQHMLQLHIFKPLSMQSYANLELDKLEIFKPCQPAMVKTP